MSIKIGDIVQTDKYKHGNYLGRMILVQNIQDDIEDKFAVVAGPFLLKSGKVTETIYEATIKV